jgi:uncharacterized protein (DUF1800 family)
MNPRRSFLRHSSALVLTGVAGGLAALPGCASQSKSTPPVNGSVAPGFRMVSAPTVSSIRANASSADLDRAVHLLNRLGFGPRPGDIEELLSRGVDSYIEQQLNPDHLKLTAILQAELDALPTLQMQIGELTGEYQVAIAQFLSQQNQQAQQAEQTQTPLQPAPMSGRRQIIREVAFDATRNRLIRAIDSPRQLEEVMIDFWYNHFNVFIGKALDRVLVGHYEQQAIRPHALGRFRDLLGATAKHPAMLFYLDNAQSVVPGFIAPAAARLRGGTNLPPPGRPVLANGLNENYARELMELHTLGVDGGYTQKDVTELARMLTGWTFDRRDSSGQAFRYDDRRHDHGEKIWMGRKTELTGLAEGEWALDTLAAHPATARHIGFKLAQYFVADQPPDRLVQTLAQAFLKSEGDIRQVLRSLFNSAEFWDPAYTKFKTPYQFVVSSVRAAGISLPSNVQVLQGSLIQLGMPLYGCPTPDGYKNTEVAWLSADAMTRRLSFATALANGRVALNRAIDVNSRAGVTNALSTASTATNAQPAARAQGNPNAPTSMPALDWNALLHTLGPTIKSKTRAVIETSSPDMRAALVLGSPEFMRR